MFRSRVPDQDAASIQDAGAAAAYRDVLQRGRNASLLKIFTTACRGGNTVRLKPPLALAVIPGAFYRDYPQHRADGRAIQEAAAMLGWEAQVVPLPSFCSVSQGAEMIGHWLSKWQGPPLVLISLSKGSTDALCLLGSGSADYLHAKVRAWISVSGLLCGTHLVNFVHSKKSLRLFLHLLFLLKGYRFADLDSLRPERVPVEALDRLRSASFPMLHIVGFPFYGDLSSPLAKRGVWRLLHIGAGDGGGMMLRDALRFPGEVVPLKGSDHYMRDISPEGMLLGCAAVLSEIEAQAEYPAHPPPPGVPA